MTATADTLPVVEVTTTLQGEGPSAGRPATLVRLGGCNLSCVWCDVPFTWDPFRFDLREQIIRRPVDDILDGVIAPIAVITGGEPLLHQNSQAWGKLLRRLVSRGVQIHIETNGTIPPSPITAAAVNMAMVSPKLAHAQADSRTGADPIRPSILEEWGQLAAGGRASLKVVVRDEEDCAEAVTIADLFGFPRSSVWLMPEGMDVATLQDRWQTVCNQAILLGVNATHRLHVLAWGDERGGR